MTPPVDVASARQHSGEPSSGLGPVDIRNDRLRNPDLASDGEIAGLADRSTQELRHARSVSAYHLRSNRESAPMKTASLAMALFML